MKKLTESKTFWVNLMVALVSLGTYLIDNSILSDPKVVAIAPSIIAGINIILRVFFTEKKIEL